MYLLLNLVAYGLSSYLQVVSGLEVQPEFRSGAEKTRDAKGGVSGDGAIALKDGRNPIGGHMQCLGKGIGCHADFGEFIFQDFSWVYGAHSVHRLIS